MRAAIVPLNLPILVSIAVASTYANQVALQQVPPTFLETSIFRSNAEIQSSLAEPSLHNWADFQDDIHAPYEGIAYFAHLEGLNCFSNSSDGKFDIAIVGAPFDLGVTYRPGARFGPAGTRMGSRRLSPSMAYSA